MPAIQGRIELSDLPNRENTAVAWPCSLALETALTTRRVLPASPACRESWAAQDNCVARHGIRLCCGAQCSACPGV